MTEVLTPDYLWERLSYCPQTGKLFWRIRTDGRNKVNAWNTRYAGTEAGAGKDSRGYNLIRIDGGAYRVHRVIWAMLYGFWPDGYIDHVDHDRNNNRPDNLRVVTAQENIRNQSMSSRNTSGHQGVYWSKRDKRWEASIKVNRVKRHLGNFVTFEEAVSARKAAEESFGFHPNHGLKLVEVDPSDGQ